MSVCETGIIVVAFGREVREIVNFAGFLFTFVVVVAIWGGLCWWAFCRDDGRIL